MQGRWLPGGLTAIGPALTALAAAGGIAGIAFSLMCKRYVGVLGAGGRPKGSPLGTRCGRHGVGVDGFGREDSRIGPSRRELSAGTSSRKRRSASSLLRMRATH